MRNRFLDGYSMIQYSNAPGTYTLRCGSSNISGLYLGRISRPPLSERFSNVSTSSDKLLSVCLPPETGFTVKSIKMATCFGDSSYVDHCYNLRKPSVSSASSRPSDNNLKVSSTNASKTTKTSQTPDPEGLEDTKVHKFTGIAAMRKIVDSQSNKLKAGGSDQYLIFKPVTTKDLADIDRHRRTIGMHTRVTHYIDTDTLVIKLMPSVEHEASHATFGQKVYAKSLRMGMADHDLNNINAGRFVNLRIIVRGPPQVPELTLTTMLWTECRGMGGKCNLNRI
jgi:hypothetical protein